MKINEAIQREARDQLAEILDEVGPEFVAAETERWLWDQAQADETTRAVVGEVEN